MLTKGFAAVRAGLQKANSGRIQCFQELNSRKSVQTATATSVLQRDQNGKSSRFNSFWSFKMVERSCKSTQQPGLGLAPHCLLIHSALLPPSPVWRQVWNVPKWNRYKPFPYWLCHFHVCFLPNMKRYKFCINFFYNLTKTYSQKNISRKHWLFLRGQSHLKVRC